MGRRGRDGTRSGAESIMLLALGTAAGLVAGVLLADRLGGVDGMRRRFGTAGVRRHRDDGWRGDERRSQRFDGLPDDHSELAPESIAHLHLHDRHPPRASHLRTRGSDRSARAARMAERIAHAPMRLEHTEADAPAPVTLPAKPLGVELERRVLEVFRNDPILADRAIDISAGDDDAIVLTGWVDGPDERRHAETIARGVPGVRAVTADLHTHR